MDHPLHPLAPGAVAVEGLSRAFRKTPVLRDVTFSLAPGTVAALVAPNGVGKTTLLRVIAGLLSSDSGRCRVEVPGRGIARPAYVPAGDRGVYWRLSGRQNLEFFARLGGIPPGEAKVRAVRAAEAFDATRLLDVRMRRCSTGQRRRASLAAGFVWGAPVVLLDEPFSDLDDVGRGAVERTSRTWADEGGIVLWAAPSRSEGPTPNVYLTIDKDGIFVEEKTGTLAAPESGAR